jgi:hypothetical protein
MAGAMDRERFRGYGGSVRRSCSIPVLLGFLLSAMLVLASGPSVPVIAYASDGDVGSAPPGSPPGPAHHGPSSPESAPPALPSADVALLPPCPVRLPLARPRDGAPSPGWVLRIERPPRRGS